MDVFALQDMHELNANYRMNIPGTFGDHNWSWRFTWDMMNSDSTRVLGFIAAISGRGAFGLIQK
jgi:4-alpha-glucanotransferase